MRRYASDATEYDGMVAAVRRQAAEKEREALQLEARAAEAAGEEPGLRGEAEAAEAAVVEAAAAASGGGAGAGAGGSRKEKEGGEEERQQQHASAASSLERLSELRTAIAEAEEEAASLKREETARELEAARYPSQAERECELERRLISLNAQLAAKRSQVESLGADKSGLERRLEDALRERR